MPFVLVKIKPQEKVAGRTTIRKLAERLPTIVANALSVPGTNGELTSNEIEVEVKTFGPLDVHHKDIEVIIWANDYPERKKNLDDRQEAITKDVKSILNPRFSKLTCFVWVILAPGSFGEF